MLTGSLLVDRGGARKVQYGAALLALGSAVVSAEAVLASAVVASLGAKLWLPFSSTLAGQQSRVDI